MSTRIHKIVFLLSLAVVIGFSCKKEIPCENCGVTSPGNTNKIPIANAGMDQTIIMPTDSVMVDGSASSDPDGTISSFQWTKISGPVSFTVNNASAASTSIKSLVAGAYRFELKVTDNGGLFARDTVQIIVDDPAINQLPVAYAGPDQSIILPVNTVNLDGSGSFDPDNNIVSNLWTKISGPSSYAIGNNSTMQTPVTNLVAGTYQFELKVTDAGALFSRDTMQVIVNQPNQPPVANAGPDQTITLPTNSVNLDASGSTDPDNNITSYLWSKISGPSSFNIADANAVQTQVTNLVQGMYQFELKVTDAGGFFAKDTTQVMVMGQPLPCTTGCKKIVFVSARDGNAEIYSCNVDGSNIQRLTYNAGQDDEPAWSPDGSRIAFISNRTGNLELYTMNANGSNVVRKTFSGSYSQSPTWSPDGTKIAYSTLSNGSLNIWVVGATSGSPSLLFEAPGWDSHPAWSPDGMKIALVSDWMAYDFVYDIYTINPDGTGFTALTGNIFDFIDYLNPSWSPSGTKLAMLITETNNPSNTQVGVMNPDGSGLTAIISGAAVWTRTSWSGDGTRIAYSSLSGDVSWVSADGSSWGTIVTQGWNADWQH